MNAEKPTEWHVAFNHAVGPGGATRLEAGTFADSMESLGFPVPAFRAWQVWQKGKEWGFQTGNAYRTAVSRGESPPEIQCPACRTYPMLEQPTVWRCVNCNHTLPGEKGGN